MWPAKTMLGTLGVLAACGLVRPISARQAEQAPVQGEGIVIAASTVLDGRGRVLRDTRIAVEGAKIVAIDRKAGPVDYDLRGLTVLPGWIDAHVQPPRRPRMPRPRMHEQP